PAPRGVPKIKVTFDLDANGILSVTAKDEATGKDQKITITANSGLSETEISKMVDDAKAHEEEDKKRREAVELRNRADQLCHAVEKSLGEVKDKLPADKVADVEAKVKSLREAIDKNDQEAIQSHLEEVEKVMQEVAAKAYESAGGAPGAAAGGAADAGAKKDDEGVIDAEFEDSAPN
ncbi:MAG: Hsp70 family protein, partial [Myxococcales bacterium]|nr:Hsp70 family protein [Myxococcales bacterium]